MYPQGYVLELKCFLATIPPEKPILVQLCTITQHYLPFNADLTSENDHSTMPFPHYAIFFHHRLLKFLYFIYLYLYLILYLLSKIFTCTHEVPAEGDEGPSPFDLIFVISRVADRSVVRSQRPSDGRQGCHHRPRLDHDHIWNQSWFWAATLEKCRSSYLCWEVLFLDGSRGSEGSSFGWWLVGQRGGSNGTASVERCWCLRPAFDGRGRTIRWSYSGCRR